MKRKLLHLNRKLWWTFKSPKDIIEQYFGLSPQRFIISPFTDKHSARKRVVHFPGQSFQVLDDMRVAERGRLASPPISEILSQQPGPHTIDFHC